MNAAGNPILRVLLFVLSSCAWFTAVSAADVSARLEPPSVRIGDTLSYELRVTGVTGKPITFPTTLPDPFVLLWSDSSRVGDGAIRYTLTATDTGRLSLSGLSVVVGTGVQAETLFAPAGTVQVRSVITDSAANLRPLKPFREHPFQWRELLGYLWIPIVVLVALAAWWLWRKYFRRRGAADQFAPELMLPAHELATRELIQLRDAKYPSRGMLKEFFTEFSLIMRRYVERRFGFPALEMTTFDLEREFEDQVYPPDLGSRLVPALREADLVKFAKYLPEFARCDSYIELGFEIVELTKPRVSAVEEPDSLTEKAA